MKILIFSWRDIKNPKAGGSEIYFHELSKEWVRRGNEVYWICGGWRGCLRNETIDKIKIIRVGNEMSLFLLAPFEYFKSKINPDVIIDNENGIPFFTPLFSKRKKVLHIHHVHKDVWFKELDKSSLKNRAIMTAGWLLESYAMPLIYRSTKVITLSKSSSIEIKKEGLCRGGVKIVNPGLRFIKYKKAEKSKKPQVLFLNRIKKYKGLDTLLEAVLKLKNAGMDNFELIVAGQGDDIDRNKEFAKINRLSNVKFLGKVSNDKKIEIMQTAWVFVNPSFKEGWGIVNIEANYFGTPVIGSRVGGIMDSVLNNKTGILFEYGNSDELADKIRFMLNNKKERERMSKEGQKWAKNFGWEVKAKEYLKILEEEIRKTMRHHTLKGVV